MTYSNCWLNVPDGQSLLLHSWLPALQPVRAWIAISHGMAEHGGRYARLAEALNQQGYAVAALDQRGHGRSAECGTRGHFADQDGWHKATGDIALMLAHCREQLPDLPLFLLGHSMGSYLVQGYLINNPATPDLAGVILSGSTAHPPMLSRFGLLAARLEGRLRGESVLATSMQRLSFGQFNQAFQPNRTDFDWLSRDPLEVDAYIQDPLCGFAVTARLWQDLFGGLLDIARRNRLAAIQRDLPLFIVGGGADPVSAGKGLLRLRQRLVDAGLTAVSLRLYDDARHELFNEINRDEVVSDLLEWLATHQPKTTEATHVPT